MVETIDRETIEAIMHEVVQTPLDDYEYLLDEMLEDQPVIAYYLYELDPLPFGFEEDMSFNEAERDYIFDIGIIIWKVLKESHRSMHSVTWEELDAVIEETEVYFFALGQDPSEIPGAVLQMIETHPEPELLRFIVDAVRPQENNLADHPIRPEYHKIVLILFQIVLNAMMDRREV